MNKISILYYPLHTRMVSSALANYKNSSRFLLNKSIIYSTQQIGSPQADNRSSIALLAFAGKGYSYVKN